MFFYYSHVYSGIFKLKLEEDFIRVEMYRNGFYHVEFHAHISTRSQKAFRKTALKRKGERNSSFLIITINYQLDIE